MACEQLLTEELRARGLRRTPQREMVLAALHELGGHASVEETYQHVHQKSDSVEKSTVYRALELLRELGIVIEVDIGDNILRYELAAHGPHGHLVCTKCGRNETFDLAELGLVACKLMQRSGFMVDEHQVFRGLCRACCDGTDCRGSANR